MTREFASYSADPMIAELIDVREENERGEISCLALVVVRHNGESSSMLYGRAAPVTLLGSLEVLKGSVLSNELSGERDGLEHLN